MRSALALGAPGIYELPEAPLRALTGVRMDVCAFVGVAPRGPARARVPLPNGRLVRRRSVAVAVESWDEYVRLYGAFEGPGRLPYAVSAFFDQGGRRAYVVRIVHDYDDARDDDGVASAVLAPAAPSLRARNEGSWGNALRATLSFSARPLTFYPERSSTTTVALPADAALPAGAVLRVGSALRVVSQIVDLGLPNGPGTARYATLDAPLPAPPQSADVVEATFVVDDRAGRAETHTGLGLSPDHPRYVAKILQQESELVEPDGTWGDVLPADASLPPRSADGFEGGADRYPELVPDDAFDLKWAPGDENDDESFQSGVQCLLGIEDVAMVVVPDLYEPSPVPPSEDILPPPSLAGPTFERCADPPRRPTQAHDVPELEGLYLDPSLPSDLATITQRQVRLAELAAYSRSFVALLDVPPGLSDRRILDWRTSFATAFAACYHPWLEASRLGDPYASPIRINPAAVAAGIVARRELELGVPFGPANELAAGVVDVIDRVSGPRHDALHQSAINVFLHERDGVRLTAARTLSRDPDYRQLSVRRLVTMIERTLERELQWLVFEPNSPAVRRRLRQDLVVFLRGLYDANAFVGATEQEAFFVRCDETLNPQPVVDAGQLVCQIGIAPAEPLEFILVQIAREGDGTLRVGGNGV